VSTTVSPAPPFLGGDRANRTRLDGLGLALAAHQQGIRHNQNQAERRGADGISAAITV
jgi:hypothetical protein